MIVGICLLGAAQLVLAKEEKYDYNYADLSNRCQVYDPYESFNRKIFVFNSVMDAFVLRPIAKGYGRFTNDYTKERVGSFLNNIQEPLSTVNYGMQGNGDGVSKTFWRFMINSTFGIGGLFDVAGKFDLKNEPQTFGNTLAYYGVGQGPYIILPFFSGMGARDMMDPLLLNTYLNPLKYYLHSSFKNVIFAGGMVHNRDQIMSFTDYVSKNSPDPYIAIRDATLSARENRVVYPDGFVCRRVNK
jgi:phospholipid-binding lipoprotein MlaA